MKFNLIVTAASAMLSLATIPALAAEGNGEPFGFRTPGITTQVQPMARDVARDVGSAQYPDMTGRAGSNLTELAANVLPDAGNETPVQTANSLPRGFEQGMLAYARPAQASAVQTASR